MIIGHNCVWNLPPPTSLEELVDLLGDLLPDAVHLLGLFAARDLDVVLGDGGGRLPVRVGLELLLRHRLLVRRQLVEEVRDPQVHALLQGNFMSQVS